MPRKIDTPMDLFNHMQTIEYGYVDLSGSKNTIITSDFQDQYRLRSPKDIEKSQIGICWDQVEVERYYFKQIGLKFLTFCIVYYGKEKYPNHTFLVYYENGKVYWFEHAFMKYSGIHEYDNIENLIHDVKDKFVADLQEKPKGNHLCLYDYAEPKLGINCREFYTNFEKNGPNEILWAK